MSDKEKAEPENPLLEVEKAFTRATTIAMAHGAGPFSAYAGLEAAIIAWAQAVKRRRATIRDLGRVQ